MVPVTALRRYRIAPVASADLNLVAHAAKGNAEASRFIARAIERLSWFADARRSTLGQRLHVGDRSASRQQARAPPGNSRMRSPVSSIVVMLFVQYLARPFNVADLPPLFHGSAGVISDRCE